MGETSHRRGQDRPTKTLTKTTNTDADKTHSQNLTLFNYLKKKQIQPTWNRDELPSTGKFHLR